MSPSGPPSPPRPPSTGNRQDAFTFGLPFRGVNPAITQITLKNDPRASGRTGSGPPARAPFPGGRDEAEPAAEGGEAVPDPQQPNAAVADVARLRVEPNAVIPH